MFTLCHRHVIGVIAALDSNVKVTTEEMQQSPAAPARGSPILYFSAHYICYLYVLYLISPVFLSMPGSLSESRGFHCSFAPD